MSANKLSTQFTITVSEAERAELLILLERELRETHMEARRTESPDFQDEVHHHEAVLHGMLEKVRGS